MPPVPQPGSGLLCRIRAGAGGFEESAQTRTCGRARTSAAENCAVAPRSSVLRNEDRRHLTETDEQGAARMLFVLALSLSLSLPQPVCHEQRRSRKDMPSTSCIRMADTLDLRDHAPLSLDISRQDSRKARVSASQFTQ